MPLLSITNFSQKEEDLVLNNRIRESKLTEGFLIKPAFYSIEFNVDEIKFNQQFAKNTKKQTSITSCKYKICNEISKPQNSLLKNRSSNLSLEKKSAIFLLIAKFIFEYVGICSFELYLC